MKKRLFVLLNVLKCKKYGAAFCCHAIKLFDLFPLALILYLHRVGVNLAIVEGYGNGEVVVF